MIDNKKAYVQDDLFQEEYERQCNEDVDISYVESHVEEYRVLLKRVENEDKSLKEADMQDFLEKHTAFIPTHHMLNHQVHLNAFISKLPIGPWKCDLAYLTKSTVEWNLVLIELENPKDKLFKGNVSHAEFSSAYTHAMQQIRDWKDYINEHRNEVLESILALRKPLEENRVYFKYILVMGRRSELENSQARRASLANLREETKDTVVITYDTILSDYERHRRIPAEGLVLSLYNGNKFQIKYLPENEISTSIFTYVSPENLKVSDEQIEALKNQNYEMDSWCVGKPLCVNGKYSITGRAMHMSEGKLRRKLLEDMPDSFYKFS